MFKAARKKIPFKIRKYFRNPFREAYYHGTARWRALPDFIIIGVMKSGTTSLFDYLKQHPRIYGSRKKEIHYFDWNHGKKANWYRSYFPFRHVQSNGYITGEASPLYILLPPVAQRIYSFLPEVKLIAILRNPTDRALSHYYHAVKSGHEKMSIMEALNAEEDRTKASWDKVLSGDCSYDHAIIWFTYKQRGLYLQQIQHYLQYFPREHLLIESTENLQANPDETLSRIFTFLGVEPCHLSHLVMRNKNTNKKEVSSEVYRHLDTYFKPHNEELFAFLGKDFGWNNSD